MGSRSKAEFGGGVNPLAMLVAFGVAAVQILMGVQAVLNLQYLPSQLTDMTRLLATTLNVPLPTAGLFFLASGVVWLPIGITLGIVIGRATA